jgi:hypothetical protein
LSPLTETSAPIAPVESHDDAVLRALDELITVLTTIGETRDRIVERAQHIRSRRANHEPYSTIVPEEQRPLIVERARASLNDLVDAAGKLQRAEARALHDEGLSMDRIGALFGVSRQRVADFLRSP